MWLWRIFQNIKMLHISEKKIIDYDNYLSLAKSLGIHIHENLFINKIEDNNYGIFTKGEIDNKDKIISVPKKFLISQSVIKDFILEKKIEYPNLDFLKLYFSSIPNLEYFKNNHVAFADNDQKNNILNFFIEQSPSRRKIKSFFNYVDKLDLLDKYIFLVFRSRGFNFENIPYLAPVLDMVNYKFGGVRALTDKQEIYFKIKETLKANHQFFQGYEMHSDIIFFYLQFNFIPEKFNLISIPPNFFSMKIPDNNVEQINENYWNINNGTFSNKSYIVFEDLKLPLDFKLEINKIIKNPSVLKKILNSILGLLKNEINYENLSNFLNKESNEQKVIDFAKVVNLNYINISEAIKNLDN